MITSPQMVSGGLALIGRHAVITGASRGIGKAIALLFAESGADVGIIGRSAASLQQLTSEIQQRGRKAVPVLCDVTNPIQVERMAAELTEKLGPVEVLVNNAGASGSAKFLDHPDELWHRMLAVNLTSTYYVTKSLVRNMVEQRWGRIINIGSVASRLGSRYTCAYTASKHGVLGLTRALAAELLPYNITVNAICPGYVDTPMTSENIERIGELRGRSEAQIREVVEAASPQHRLMTPEEIAALALFLAQNSSGGITGQALNLDGGMGMFY